MEVGSVESRIKEENIGSAEGNEMAQGSRAWLLYLLAGVLATGGYFVLPSASAQNIVYNLIGLSAVAAIVVGTRTHRPVRPLPWYVLALGLLILVVGEVVYAFYENVLGVEPTFPSVADAFYLLAMPFLAAGLVLMHRSRVPGRQWGNLIDALIIATVAGMLSWIFLIEPQATDPILSPLERLISIAYPLMDLVLLVAALQLWFVSDDERLPAHHLLNASLVFLLIADTAYAAALQAGTYETGRPLDAGWLLFYVLFGAAALHPSMVVLSEPGARIETKLTWRRLVLLTAVSLIAPVLLAYQAAFDEQIDVPVLVGGSAVLFLLVALRMAGMIRERRRAEEEVKRANRRLEELAVLKADFTAMIAHELGGPLAAIRRLAEVLSAEGSDAEVRSYSTIAIEGEIDALNALVADVQSAAIIERDDFKVVLRPVLLATLLTDAEAYAETLDGGHPIEFALAGGLNGEEQVWADPERVGQVLRNLLSNAAKYSPDGEPIELRAKRSQQRILRIEVADHGRGIRPDDQVRIFEKFGRGRDQEGRKVGGVGLGLYLSRRIIRSHGSEITVSSTPGEGSAFGFELEVVR